MKNRPHLFVFLAATVLFSIIATAISAAPPDLEQTLAQKIVAVWTFADKAEMKDAFAEHLDVMEFHYGQSVKFLTDAETLAALQGRGYAITVEIPDIMEFNRSRMQTLDMGGYRTLAEIELALDTLHNLNPSITTAKFSIGQTIEGREMWAIKISDNPEIDEDEPEALFDAATHAREVITPLVLIETMRTLIIGYGIDTMLTRLVDTREMFFIPCVNPDGYYYNEFTNPGGGGMWRKNRRNNGDGTYGVDLNRNFTYMWGYDNEGSSPIPGDATYRGASAGSEPEIQNYMNFVESREFITNITFHSYSNLILWPYGYEYNVYSPDEPLFATLGDNISAFNNYTPTIAWGLYPTNGSTDDWNYGEQTTKDKIFSFTIEVGSSSDNFWPPTYRIPELVGENIPAVLFLIDIAGDPCAPAPPLAPLWAAADTMPTGFFDLVWSQPDNQNEVVGFEVLELAGPQIGADNAESGSARWTMNGFSTAANRKYDGSFSFYSGLGDNLFRTMTTAYPMYVTGSEVFEFYTYYRIEDDWDYAYVEVSTDPISGFAPIPGNITTTYDPHLLNRGHGITGSTSSWTHALFDLSAFAGQYIYLRLTYATDGGLVEEGFYADVISPIAWFDQTEVLAAAYADSSLAVNDRPVGEYYFKVRATDADDQTGPYSALSRITVEGEVIYGDLDANTLISPVDVIWLVNLVYRSGPPPLAPGAEYINGDAFCNPVDVSYLVNHVYRGGAPPLGYAE
jgi:murein tripeptide amidase MpaA